MRLFPKIKKLESNWIWGAMDNNRYVRLFWIINTDIQTKKTSKLMIRSWVDNEYIIYAPQIKIRDTISCLIYVIGYWYFKKLMDKYPQLHKWWSNLWGQKMYINNKVGTEVSEKDIEHANFNRLMWKNNI